MPIDPAKALGATVESGAYHWDKDRIMLYHLGVGAGAAPTDANELTYTYEKDLKVLPSWGVIPAFEANSALRRVEGMDFNPALLLHGEQDLEVLKHPIPTEATVTTSGKVAEIYDKGKAALVIMETITSDAGGDPLFRNRFSLFIRGEGGFGGDPGPAVGNQPPDRDPDHVVESPTLPQQALLYRLSGDKNPLHADPEFAKMGGFDQPILHGLCSFGIVCKAVVDNVLGGDTSKVQRYQARFAGVVYPGETIVTTAWQDGGKVLVDATTKERGTPVISNAAVTIG